MTRISWDESVRTFLYQAGSSSPTPGGGSTAALTAALGASMTAMAGRFSSGEEFDTVHPQIEAAIGRMKDLSAQCEELLHADMTSFNTYLDALKLPRNTEEEEEYRKSTVHDAIIRIIEVPMRLIEACRDGVNCSYSIAEITDGGVASDLGIGAILFEAATQSAGLTVEINLALLHESEQKRQYLDKLNQLNREVAELKSKILLIARKKIRERSNR